jgi:hypothetical protein
LTLVFDGDKMFRRTTWARSSMAEQWPFKPLVGGSSPLALTDPQFWGFFI